MDMNELQHLLIQVLISRGRIKNITKGWFQVDYTEAFELRC